MAYLCISLDNSSVNTVHIMDGELMDIDKYTINYNNVHEILKEFPEKIEELTNIYNIEDNASNIELRIFLSNDKEQFVMYRKYLIIFKLLLRNIEFLRYATSYDSTIFEKNIIDIINDSSKEYSDIYSVLKNELSNLDKEKYIELIRKLCNQYEIYVEDYDDEKIPTIDKLYTNYLRLVKQKKLEKTSEMPLINKNKKNPFVVFEHPNFFKVYGKSINKEKPVFIIGCSKEKNEYKEISDNCSKCFENPIYYSVDDQVDEKFIQLYSNSLFVIVNGNSYNELLIKKILFACKKNITTIILSNNTELLDYYNSIFSKYDTILIKKYILNDYDSQKQFADIIAGFYIKQYKNSKEKVGE